MRRNLWVFLVSVLLVGMIGACVSEVEQEDTELHPTFLLTPYATDTLTPHHHAAGSTHFHADADTGNDDIHG